MRISDKKKFFKEYLIITISILIMAFGVYFFKFPNGFAFGGLSGYGIIVEALTGINPVTFTNVTNTILLILGFIFLGKDFGAKTVYASIIFTIALHFLDVYIPMTKPLTSEPLLELLIAVFLPTITTVYLFNTGASSGGTDIIAMILRKYSTLDIVSLMFIVDLIAACMAFFVLGVEKGIFTVSGLMIRAVIMSGVIENINLSKCFTIMCDDPTPICEFIIHELNRSATIYEATGAFTHNKKTVILTTMTRVQAVKLRNFIKENDPGAFMMITNSSEIIGKGFQNV